MGECKSCIWSDGCFDMGERCEHFYGSDDAFDDMLKEAEYEASLCERVEDYEELVEEQQG